MHGYCDRTRNQCNASLVSFKSIMCVCVAVRVGKLVYDNGESYEGEWNRGKRHGKGIYVYLNGERAREGHTHSLTHSL
jgi:hypothetical protein